MAELPELVDRFPLSRRRGDDRRAPMILDSSGRPLYASRIDSEAFTNRTPGPGVPLVPALPPGEPPREFVPRIGQNLNYIPRSAFPELTPFQTLRNLADSSDIVRIVVSDVIQQVVGLDWDVHPIDDKVDAASAPAAPGIARAKAFLAYPDRERSFKAWLSSLLEDCLVLDALCFARQLDVSGRPHSLVQVDGATIVPLVDALGRIPEAPHAGYQQVAYGRVETEFHRPYVDREDHAAVVRAAGGDPAFLPAELVYVPRSPRVWSPYGQSPLERVIITVNMALRRQLHFLAFYTDGNIPEAFWKCPPNWEPHQVLKMQDDFEKLLQGESGARRRLRFMPGGEGAGLENPRGDDEWKKEYDEWLARIVCFSYSTSPLPLVQMMNRATGEMADAEETHSGAHPLMEYVSCLLTREIQDFLGEPGLEFIWTEDKEANEQLFVEKSEKFVARGIYTRNEVRALEGLEKIEGGDVPTVDTASGPIPLSEFTSAPPVPIKPTGGGPAGPLAGIPLPPAAAVAPAKPSPALDVPLPPAAGSKMLSRMVVEDLRRWRKVAMKDVRDRRRVQRDFESRSIPPALQKALKEWLDWAGFPEDVAWAFRVIVKSRRPLVTARRRIRLERRVRSAAKEHFASVAPAVAALLAKYYIVPTSDKRQVSKADEPPDEEVDASMNWNAFADSLRPVLYDGFLEGETLAQDAGGAEIAFGLTDEQAAAYAADRAAELVGKRVLEDGTVVDNPNARWSIPKSVREKLRSTVSKAFQEGWTEARLQQEIESPAFWSWRSDMIARTEVALALNHGTVQAYRAGGIEMVEIVDGPGCLEDGHDDAVAGVDGEVWSVEKFDEYPVGHPNCRRDAIPQVPEVNQ